MRHFNLGLPIICSYLDYSYHLVSYFLICTDLKTGPTWVDVGGCDEPLIDHVRGLGPVPSTGPIDCPPGMEVGHAASTFDSEQTHTCRLRWRQA